MTPQSGSEAVQEAALRLDLQQRRGKSSIGRSPPCAYLTLALLWSLPRDDVIALNETISQSLQKDIVGCLPPELAGQILAYLDLADILQCNQVSSHWSKLCSEQSLWASLCLTHHPPLRPRHTTWADINTHQQLMHLSDSYVQSDKDEGAFESGFEELSFHTDIGGVDLSPSITPTHGQTQPQGTNSGTGMSMRGGIRGLVWERSGSGLPTHLHVASSSRSVTPRKAPRSGSGRASPDIDKDESYRPHPDCPISSHLNAPTPLPQPNHKHLYISHAILRRRLRAGQGIPKSMPGTGHTARQPQLVRPRIIDAISSIEAGGLPGHAETIYSLQLIARRMTIKLVHSGPDGQPSRAHTPTPFDRPMGAGSGSPMPSPARPGRTEAEPTVTGRDWLLSASRDHTLRLWLLSCPRPHVVKTFTEGHVGSVLCHATVEIAIKDKERDPHESPASTQSRGRRRSLKPEKTRLVAVSGGSDGRLCLWDVEHGDGRPEVISEEHTDGILCVKADAERVVTSSKDRTIRLFDVQTLDQMLVIDCAQEGLHRGAINSVCLTKDYIISASGDKTIRVWCILTGLPVADIEAGERGIASMDFSPAPPRHNSSLRGTIVTGSSDASIKLFHVVSATRQQERGVELVDALDMIPPVRDMTLREMLDHEDGNEYDLSASIGSNEDETTSIRTATTRMSISDTNDPDSHSTSGQRDADTPPNPGSSSHRHTPPEELRIEPAGRCWAACNCPPGMNKSDSTLCRRCCNRGHTELVRSVSFGETVIISGSYDSTVKVWDRSSGQLLANLSGVHSGRIFSVAGDRMRVVSSGLDSRISIWDFAEGIDTSFVEP